MGAEAKASSLTACGDCKSYRRLGSESPRMGGVSIRMLDGLAFCQI
jgi:hypothetical protein